MLLLQVQRQVLGITALKQTQPLAVTNVYKPPRLSSFPHSHSPEYFTQALRLVCSHQLKNTTNKLPASHLISKHFPSTGDYLL